MSIVCTLLNVQTVLTFKWRLFLLPSYLFRHLYSTLSSTYIYTRDPPVELEASFSDNPRLSVKFKGPASFDYIYLKKNFASILKDF